MTYRVIQQSTQPGFALPTVLVASLTMLLILATTLVSVSAVAASLRDRSVNILAKEAAESGVVLARACLAESGGIVTWSDTNPLRPNTNCFGGPACTDSPNCFVHQSTNMRTTFKVTAADTLYNSTYAITVAGTAELVRTSTQLPWRSFYHQSNTIITLTEEPRLSGGGWLAGGGSCRDSAYSFQSGIWLRG